MGNIIVLVQHSENINIKGNYYNLPPVKDIVTATSAHCKISNINQSKYASSVCQTLHTIELLLKNSQSPNPNLGDWRLTLKWPPPIDPAVKF